MYCKLFASLYQGTLRGHSHEILVFTNLLANCDKEGVVDKHYRAIAEEVGLDVEQVKTSIRVLESPDPESRSHELGGARIVRMDEHRDWGWRIVNYLKYRSIREEDDRREQNRLSQQRFREKRASNQESYSKQSKPPSATVSPGNPIQKHQEEEVPLYVQKKDTFKEFWDIYPKKIGKGNVEKIWNKINPSEDMVLKILAAVQAQAKSEQWLKDGGQFIPLPATWLNQGRWDDELFAPKTNKKLGACY